jgi:tol-pal system protein YbgF
MSQAGIALRIRFRLSADGSLLGSPEVVDASRMKENPYRSLAESAIRAVRQCVPLKGLPAEKYEHWREIVLTFNPATLGDSGMNVASPANHPIGSVEEQYNLAFGKLTQLDYAGAEEAFRAFIQRNPTHDLTSNAYYWLGESFYARNIYGEAAQAFETLYLTYPKATKVPDALLKFGLSKAGSGHSAEACGALRRLKRDHPNADIRLHRRADSELARISCG